MLKINKNLLNIYLLFTRDPSVRYTIKELEGYRNEQGDLIGFVAIDLVDNDYSVCVLARDNAMKFRATKFQVNIPTIKDAREWLEKTLSESLSFEEFQENLYFDLFKNLNNEINQHPHFSSLKNNIALLAAKQTILEISYHYKDIDGNFIDQFQSINGFDSRIWELYLYSFFREQYFNFNREHEAPDFMVEKDGERMAIEAVIVGRKTKLTNDYELKDKKRLDTKLENEIPLMFGSALHDKAKMKYWNKKHVKNIPFVISIADFHDAMSMTWTFSALLEYLFGHKFSHRTDEKGNNVPTKEKISFYTKPNGTKIPSGFFLNKENENISAIMYSACGTLSKFNRIGKQAGLGTELNELIRTVSLHDHDPNAVNPEVKIYTIDTDCKETWSEGVVIYHNPHAIKPINPNLFEDNVAQFFFAEENLISFIPKTFPYNSQTLNVIKK